MDQIVRQIRALALHAGAGNFTEAELDGANGSLSELGFTSLSYISLIEALEKTFGIIIDPETDPAFLESLETIACFVAGQLGWA